MKSYNLFWKSACKTNLFIYCLWVITIASCSKPVTEPIVIATPKEETKLSNKKEITSFVFLLTNNAIDTNVVATIDEENKTISAAMPAGTNLSGLLPEVKISVLATVDLDTAQDFSNPLDYTITAEDGSKTVYTVTITALLMQRQILQAILDANPGNTLDWDLQSTADLGALNGVTTSTEGEIVQLNLQARKLTSIPSETGQLTNLTRLALDANKLTELPSEIGQLSNLTTLTFSDNQVSTLPLEIGQLTNLKVLSLYRNQLSILPPEIGQLTNLTRLILATNQLSMLPPEIGQLTNLTELSSNGNQFTSLPPEIGQLTNLTALSLSGNELSELPPEIGQLSNLTELDLAENQLSELPSEIGQLTSLELLRLSFNELSSLPTEINKLFNLKELALSNNNLSEFNHVPFMPSGGIINILDCSTQTNLEQLYLTGNPDLKTLNQCICDLDLDNGGTVDIDVVPDGVTCVGNDVIGN